MFEKKKPRLGIFDIQDIEKDILDTLHASGEIQQAIREEVRDYIRSGMQSAESPIINHVMKSMVHTFMNDSQITTIIDDAIMSQVHEMFDDSALIDEEVQRRVDDAGIDRVIQWNNAAYSMVLSRIDDIEEKFTPNTEMQRHINDIKLYISRNSVK